MKKLIFITSFIFLSIVVFTQDTKWKTNKNNLAYVIKTNYEIPYNNKSSELNEAYDNLNQLFNELSEEIKYNPNEYDMNQMFDTIISDIKYDANDFVEKELQEEQLNN